MIVPTPRAAWLAAAGVPVALGVGLVDEGLWVAGPAWVALVAVMLGMDAVLCRWPLAFAVAVDVPGVIEVGRTAVAGVRVEGRAPEGLEVALEGDERLEIRPGTLRLAGGRVMGGVGAFSLWPRRRGMAVLSRLHLRWAGPLGLVRRVEVRGLDRTVRVVPQIGGVREQAMRLFSRDRRTGNAVVRERADTAEFRALREFQSGDDKRGINWRQSARHVKLLVRETEAERNRTISIALDTGRLMCEPLAGGLPRLDHALNAALVLAYVALKVGDRVGLWAFDAKPVLASGTVSGPGAFGPLQRLAAGLDYSTAETNFTLGLTGLGAALPGRALVIVFTDFADPTGAELMVENVGRLLERHVVLFVAFRDDALEALAAAAPDSADAVARAVVAGTLLAEREAVLTRLRRLGVDVLETPAAATGPALIARYLDGKRGDGKRGDGKRGRV